MRRSIQQQPDPAKNNILIQTSSDTEEFNLNKTLKRLSKFHFETEENEAESEMSGDEQDRDGQTHNEENQKEDRSSDDSDREDDHRKDRRRGGGREMCKHAQCRKTIN